MISNLSCLTEIQTAIGASLENSQTTCCEVQGPTSPFCSKNQQNSLGTGAIIGIAIGGAAFVIILAALIALLCLKAKGSKKLLSETEMKQAD